MSCVPQLILLNRTYPLAQVIQACRDYAAKTKRRVTLEYIMLEGVNDGEADLARLVELTVGWLCHVNLIPYNPVPAVAYRPSAPRGPARSFSVIYKKRGWRRASGKNAGRRLMPPVANYDNT